MILFFLFISFFPFPSFFLFIFLSFWSFDFIFLYFFFLNTLKLPTYIPVHILPVDLVSSIEPPLYLLPPTYLYLSTPSSRSILLPALDIPSLNLPLDLPFRIHITALYFYPHLSLPRLSNPVHLQLRSRHRPIAFPWIYLLRVSIPIKICILGSLAVVTAPSFPRSDFQTGNEKQQNSQKGRRKKKKKGRNYPRSTFDRGQEMPKPL